MTNVSFDIPYIQVNALAKFAWQQEFQYLDDSQLAVDLTGYTATLRLRRESLLADSSIPAAFTALSSVPNSGIAISSALEGKVLVNITSALQASNNLSGKYALAIFLTPPSADDIPLAVGTIDFALNAK